MNRTFKVAKSLTRGVVVTSEKASSYQGKAVKTVVAAAVAALVAGTTVAAETASDETPTPTYGWTTQEGITNATISTEVKIADGNKYVSSGDALTIADGAKVVLTSGQHIGVNSDVAETAKGVISVAGGEVSLDSSGLHANDFTQSGGTITVGNKSAANVWANHANVGGYYTYTMTGGTMNVNEGGRLWIGSGDGDTPATMKFQGGTLNLKGTETNYAIVSTMTLGSFSNANGEEYAQPLSFEGTNVNVDGSALLMSRDIQIGGGVIKVNDDAHLYLLAEKQLSSDGKVLTSATSDTCSKGSVTVTGGEITVAEKGTLSVAHNDLVLKGGMISNAGTLQVNKLTIQGGTVNTVAGAKYAVATTSLEKNGTLNLTALNSNQFTSLNGGPEEGKTPDDYAKDQFLVYGTLNLNGGTLLANGEALQKMKVGSGSTAARVNVNSDFAIADLAFGTKGTVKVAEDATLTVNDLYLTVNDENTTSITNNGTVVVTGDVTTPKGLAVSDMQDAVFVNNGTVYTNIDNVVTLTSADGKISAAAITAFGSILNGDEGNVYESADRTLTLAEYNKIAAAMDKLTMLNTVVTSDTAGEDLKFSDVASTGLNSPSTTVVAEASASGAKSVDVAVENNKSVVVSNVEANYETVNVNGQGTLQLAGNDGVLFGEDVKTVKVTNGGLVLGHEQFAAKTGEIVGEVDIDQNSTVTVEAGTFAVAGLAGKGTVDVEDGGFTTNYASAEGTINVNGSVAAVLGNKPVTTATAAAGEEGAEEEPTPFEGAVKVGTVTFGTTGTTTLALTPVEPTESDGIFAVGVDAATAAADVAANYDNLDGKKVVYLTKQVEFTAVPATATDYLVDLGKVAATEHFSAEDGVMNNELGSSVTSIKLINLDAAALSGKSGEKVLQFSQKTDGSTATVAVDFGNWFYGSSYYAQYDGVNDSGFSAASGQITFKPNEYVVDHVQDMNLGQAAIQAADDVVWGQNEIVDAIGFGTVAYAKVLKDSDTYKALVQQDADNADADKYTSLAQDYLDGMMDTYLDQLDIASELAIAGGVFGTTLDINDQVTAALDRRTSLANLNAPRTEGFTPWVDVFGTKNEAKRIYGEGAGYEADIYGAVLGFDYTAACGGVLGLAFNVGQADGNSVGIGSAKVENDADFYGVSLYAAQTFGDFNVKADLGHTQVKNDLKMNGVTKTWKESQDADVITFGVGTEYLVKAGALNVVPHAGIRMTRIDLDDSKYGAEYETMTVYQMPLGVAFSGTFDTNGWKVAPMVDLSVVPTFGDKDAEAKYFGGVKDVVRVVDSNPIRATLGVEAQTGAWTFGVNYGLTAGSDDRLKNSFNANARYTF